MKLSSIFRWSFLKWVLPLVFAAIGTIYAALTYHFPPHPETAKETAQPAAQSENYKSIISKDKQSTPPSQLAQSGKESVVKENTMSKKAESKNIQTSEQTTTPRKIIGKKITVSVGDEPPKDDPNEIVGENTTVHVPSSGVGKYDRIVGEEIKVIVGDPKEKK